jgi:hypothetical protein
VAGPPLRKAQRVLQQRNAVLNPFPKQRSQRPRSRTRFLNNPVQKSRRRNLRSNCGWRATWRWEARRHRGGWSRIPSQERLNKSYLLQRRGLKPKGPRAARKLGRKNWPRKGGGWDGWGTRCRHPVRGEGRSIGLRLVVKSQQSGDAVSYCNGGKLF